MMTTLLAWVLLLGGLGMVADDAPEYEAWRVLDEASAQAAAYPFVLSTGDDLLLYVAEIEHITGWPDDRFYVLDLEAGEVRADSGIYRIALDSSQRFYAVGRSLEATEWAGPLDTLLLADVDYDDYRYARDEAGEPLEISVLSIIEAGSGDTLASWFPAGGYFTWRHDDTLVTCTANWEVLNRNDFEAAGFWRAIGGPDFGTAVAALAPVSDTVTFDRYPEPPWALAYEVKEWPTRRGTFVTAEPDTTVRVEEFWSRAVVMRVEEDDSTAIMPGRLLAADSSGVNLIVEEWVGEHRRTVWYRLPENQQ